MRLRLGGLVGLALLGVQAAAQVGQSTEAVLKAPALAEAKRFGGGLLSLKDGSSLLLRERGGFLVSARVSVVNAVPSGSSLAVSGGTSGASGSASGQAVASVSPGQQRMAQLVGLLTGLGEGIQEPFVNFLNQPDVVRDLAKGVSVNAGAYAMQLSSRGNLLTVEVSLARKADDQFAKAAHVLPARKETARPVSLRIYSDFQCPYCKQLESQTLPELLKALPEDVQVEFHQFPLESIHPLARPAAEASECAAQQGKFWEFKDVLFSDASWQQGNPNLAFIQLASKVGLAPELFKSCLAERGGKDAVDAGVQAATKLGLTGTPTVFVNGYRAANAYDAKGLLQLIDFARVADQVTVTPSTPKP